MRLPGGQAQPGGWPWRLPMKSKRRHRLLPPVARLAQLPRRAPRACPIGRTTKHCEAFLLLFLPAGIRRHSSLVAVRHRVPFVSCHRRRLSSRVSLLPTLDIHLGSDYYNLLHRFSLTLDRSLPWHSRSKTLLNVVREQPPPSLIRHPAPVSPCQPGIT